MAHIHTDPGQHDFTTSAYIILQKDGEEPRLWLHRHRIIGQWLQFGGHVELHENPWQTLEHEVLEESGYELSQLKLLQPTIRPETLTGVVIHPLPCSVLTLPFPGVPGHFHTDMAYVFVTDELPLHQVGDGESSIVTQVTLDELRTISEGEIPPNVQELAIFIMETLLSKWEQINCDVYKS